LIRWWRLRPEGIVAESFPLQQLKMLMVAQHNEGQSHLEKMAEYTKGSISRT
jgi:hypothetical protein